MGLGHYLVRHGRLPSIILRFVVPEYSAGHENLIFEFSLSDPGLVCPHTCRQLDLLVPWVCTSDISKWNCQLHKYRDHSYADHGLRASWAHASQSHFYKSYRGSFSLFGYFLCLHTRHLAPRLGQAIHPIYILGSHRELP